jgi:thiamine biosynthesis protein ThiI
MDYMESKDQMTTLERIILVKYEEIFLKGDNRGFFEKRLMDNMRKALIGLGSIKISKNQGRVYVIPKEPDYPVDEAVSRLAKVFGINAVSPCVCLPVDYEAVAAQAVAMAAEISETAGMTTFKVETKRADKNFPMTSMEVSANIGSRILDAVPQLKVDVNTPTFVIHLELRDKAYLYSQSVPGAKGLPTGSSGKATLLLSGGIDSPVAGWMIAKRGVTLEAVHFYSYPYTSERARDKVVALADILSEWTMGVKLHVVPFTEIQLAINEKCPADHSTIIMRRYMMRIAERIAKAGGSHALVTGEAIGQVASQTMESLLVTDNAVTLPVYRPCIGMDKNEVIDIARRIGTFETSILPYEDCCTVFVARHPVTKPSLEKTLRFETELEKDAEAMIEAALAGTEVFMLPQKDAAQEVVGP